MDSLTTRETAGEPPEAPAIVIDDLLRHWGRRTPQAVALADPPNKEELGLGEARVLTFAQADAVADRLAHNFARVGLDAGDVIALQLPNTVETVVIMLGAWRAGLTVTPLSPLWRLAETDRAFAAASPRAAVTVARFADHDHAGTICQAAVDHLSIRFAFGFGPDLPDAMTPIDEWLESSASVPFISPTSAMPGPTPGVAKVAPASALLTWSAAASGPCPVPRTHGEIATLASVFADELRLTARDALLNCFAPVSVTAIAGMLVPWLLAGGRLLLHQPFDLDIFADQIHHDEITYTAVPAAVLAALEQSGQLSARRGRLARIGCVWPAPPAGVRSTGAALALPIFDIHNLAEIGVLVRERAFGQDPTVLPLGPVRVAGSKSRAPYLVTRLAAENGSGIGEVRLRGPTVPAAALATESGAAPRLGVDGDGFLATGIMGAAVGDAGDGFRCVRSPEMIQHGGVAIAAAELDRLYAGHPDFLDAAAFAIDDPVMGDRIVAAVVPRPHATLSLEDLRRYLTDMQVAPFKLPDRLLEVHTIPRTKDGKVARNEILNKLAS